MSIAYHPQSDGATERVMQEIQAYLSIYCIANPTDWTKAIPILEFIHNSRPDADRKQSPFELIMGHQPQGLPQDFMSTKVPTLGTNYPMAKRPTRRSDQNGTDLSRSRKSKDRSSTNWNFPRHVKSTIHSTLSTCCHTKKRLNMD